MTNRAPDMAWQHPPTFFGGTQFQQQCPLGPFQYRPQGNGYSTWQPPNLTNQYQNNASSRPKRQRKEPTFIDYCDVCDRGFKNNAKKVEHYQQHIKCDEPGCSFEAHFKLVAIHKQNLHGPNALRIKVETPEEIQRWREERKRKYPSYSNVQQKADKMSKRERQGNVLDNKNFGKMRHKKQVTSIQRNATAQSQTKIDRVSQQDSSTNQNDIGSKSLLGLFSTSHDSSGEMSSEDDTNDQNAKNMSALGSLMQSYASSSDTELENESSNLQKVPEPFPESDLNVIFNEPIPDRNPAEFLGSDTSDSKKTSPGLQSHGHIKQNKPKRQGGHSQGKTRQSLLEMLLANDIRKERNHILQCVRYIVENNFFETEVVVKN